MGPEGGAADERLSDENGRPPFGRDETAWRSAWNALEEHFAAIGTVHMRDLFDSDPGRFERFTMIIDGDQEGLGVGDQDYPARAELLIDLSKHRATDETFRLLLELARASGVDRARRAMFAGERINTTEDRPVLHVALRNRSNTPILVDGADVMPDVNRVLDRMRRYVAGVHAGTITGCGGDRFTDVVNIGIGGSYLGPQMV